MSLFNSLIKKVEEWGEKYPPQPSFFSSTAIPKATTIKSPSYRGFQPQRHEPMKPLKPQKPPKVQRPVMLVLTVVSLTSVVGHRFYNQPRLGVGTTAPQTIYAPEDAEVEDIRTTEERRRAARSGFVPVLKIDEAVNEQIYENLETAFNEIEELREQAGSYPFTSTAVLSTPSQRALFFSTNEEWLAVRTALTEEKTTFDESLPSELQIALTELQTYQNTVSEEAFTNLLEKTSDVRSQYYEAVSLSKGQAILLELSTVHWEATKDDIRRALARTLTQGISPGLPTSVLEQAVRGQLNSAAPRSVNRSATELILNVLQPNLVEDRDETKRLAEQAAQSVQPEIVTAQEGEMIVEGGAEITQANFVLLDHFGLSHRSINWIGLAGSATLVTGAVGVFLVVKRRYNLRLRERDHILLLLLSVSTPLLVFLGVPYTNLPAIGLLVSSFYGPALGVTVVSLLTSLTGFSTLGVSGLAVAWEYLLAGAAGGLLAAVMGGRLRSREELAFLGGGVGFTQVIAYLIVNLIPSASAGAIWYILLPEALLFGLSGVAWSIVALGVSPYLERFFDLVTPIRLAELSNPNRPLLKRLATEAPGTFQHTLFVASLAEAAARELHCNVELVRAGTLYHDIGKMHDALGFIENQMGGPNKHDEINDPWKSAAIIKKHVTEGMVMARRCGLPQAIQDFIPEHQGTLQISYFYFKAVEKAKQEGLQEVQESDFRYDGPVPQSRETGIVMLADACEAALRSLKDVTPESALTVVKKIFKARWNDNQLVDSGLRWEELPIIAEVFVRVWQQSNHQRIAYPKAALDCKTPPKS